MWGPRVVLPIAPQQSGEEAWPPAKADEPERLGPNTQNLALVVTLGTREVGNVQLMLWVVFDISPKRILCCSCQHQPNLFIGHAPVVLFLDTRDCNRNIRLCYWSLLIGGSNTSTPSPARLPIGIELSLPQSLTFQPFQSSIKFQDGRQA